MKNVSHRAPPARLAIAAALSVAASAAESGAAPARAMAAPTFADLADLALPAPIVAHVRVRRAIPVRAVQAQGVRPGTTRLFVEGELVSLLRSPSGLPLRLTWLADLPDPPGKTKARLRDRSELILFAAPVPGRPAELRLNAPDAQIAWSEGDAATIRALLREETAGAAPRITGFGRAFHAKGDLPGTSETRIFLESSGGRPISISIVRHPDSLPQWSVALGELTGAAAGRPGQNSLLWYRLACTIPSDLPAESLTGAEDDGAAIRFDYRLVRESLGPCQRGRNAR